MPIDEHWKSLDLGFDAFYTGFLGSFEQIDIVCKLIDDLSDDSSTVYVDPVMADKGKLYSVFDKDFPQGMRRLCEKADVIIPNLTELCLMLGIEWEDGPYTREYIQSMLERGREFGVKRMVLTGVSYKEGEVGSVYIDYITGETGEVMRKEIPGYYHGTGDVFGSALVGACESGLPLGRAVEAAVNYTVNSIVDTYTSGDDVRYGVNFERNLPGYMAEIRSDAPVLVRKAGSEDLRILATMAERIWHSTYDGLLSPGQIEYMLDRFQSEHAMADQMSDGYEYLIAEYDGEPVGYSSYVPRDDGMFLSKLYISEGSRGHGLVGMMFSRVFQEALSHGFHRIHLTVNKENSHAISFYERIGFRIFESAVNDIGNGYVMDDYYMEKVF